MKVLKNKWVSFLLTFTLGGVTTFFVSDYIRLKNSENNNYESLVDNPERRPKPSVDSNQILQLGNSRDSFAQMNKIHDQMQKRMNNFFGRSMFGDRGFGTGFFDNDSFLEMNNDGIKIQEHEDDEFKYVEVIADGVDRDSLKIDISNGMISISGEIRKAEDNRSSDSHSFSNFMSSFNRSFNIPFGVSEENVKVEPVDNKIVIKFPKDRA